MKLFFRLKRLYSHSLGQELTREGRLISISPAVRCHMKKLNVSDQMKIIPTGPKRNILKIDVINYMNGQNSVLNDYLVIFDSHHLPNFKNIDRKYLVLILLETLKRSSCRVKFNLSVKTEINKESSATEIIIDIIDDNATESEKSKGFLIITPIATGFRVRTTSECQSSFDWHHFTRLVSLYCSDYLFLLL